MSLIDYRKGSPRLAAGAWVAPDASVIGDVALGPDSSVWFQCVLRGDVCNIEVGARSNIQDHTVIHTHSDGTPTIIGDDVTVGHSAVVHAATVEAGSLIGIGAVVLDHAIIGAGSIVAARALVTPDTVVPAGSLVMGAPGKVVRRVSDAERDWVADTVRRYLELVQEYRGAGGS